ncbi:5-(carboxyamino)imidazole ribonucleotide mutase [Actinomycetaceae bacterium TAE3-ERU4]|nr:5-(carboxyamino)imidazole ribonucleotide mutase [Actinomycetaceae bacterium TAE3-ERU4]
MSVAIIMGSDSDWKVMRNAARVLDRFGVKYETKVLSAHRMPEEMMEWSKSAHLNGVEVIIAGAGGAAHLPGMVASLTPLPVIGVPVPLRHLDGMDSLLSIVQMPAGIPVATVSIGGAKNAALLAVRMLAIGDEGLTAKLGEYREELRKIAVNKGKNLDAQVTSEDGEDSFIIS